MEKQEEKKTPQKPVDADGMPSSHMNTQWGSIQGQRTPTPEEI